ncbi:hypothetical protein B0H11DRAFT_797588 [Mycena galericulata]|nr:hypothetical protein B0H11DRAFT_797588 [Mycena galericulata]
MGTRFGTMRTWRLGQWRERPRSRGGREGQPPAPPRKSGCLPKCCGACIAAHQGPGQIAEQNGRHRLAGGTIRSAPRYSCGARILDGSEKPGPHTRRTGFLGHPKSLALTHRPRHRRAGIDDVVMGLLSAIPRLLMLEISRARAAGTARLQCDPGQRVAPGECDQNAYRMVADVWDEKTARRPRSFAPPPLPAPLMLLGDMIFDET